MIEQHGTTDPQPERRTVTIGHGRWTRVSEGSPTQIMHQDSDTRAISVGTDGSWHWVAEPSRWFHRMSNDGPRYEHSGPGARVQLPSFEDQGDRDYRDFVAANKPAAEPVSPLSFAISNGHVEEVPGKPGHYRLTEAGKQRAAELMGIEPERLDS